MYTTAIVVNFNAGDLLLECVLDLLSSGEPPLVRVADNASSDGSAKRLGETYATSNQVEIIFNQENLGFARAANACSTGTDTDYLLVINPDCRIALDALRKLRKALEEQPQAALAGPKILDGNGRVENACLRRFPDPWKSLMTFTGLARLENRFPSLAGIRVDPEALSGEIARAEAVSGACMLIRRSAFESVGRFDEAYGLHCEDLDLMYRFHQKGWHCLFVPEAGATHIQGVSSRSRPFWVHRQKHLGMTRFFNKFQAPQTTAPVRWLVHAGIWLRYALMLPWVMVRK